MRPGLAPGPALAPWHCIAVGVALQVDYQFALLLSYRAADLTQADLYCQRRCPTARCRRVGDDPMAPIAPIAALLSQFSKQYWRCRRWWLPVGTRV